MAWLMHTYWERDQPLQLQASPSLHHPVVITTHAIMKGAPFITATPQSHFRIPHLPKVAVPSTGAVIRQMASIYTPFVRAMESRGLSSTPSYTPCPSVFKGCVYQGPPPVIHPPSFPSLTSCPEKQNLPPIISPSHIPTSSVTTTSSQRSPLSSPTSPFYIDRTIEAVMNFNTLPPQFDPQCYVPLFDGRPADNFINQFYPQEDDLMTDQPLSPLQRSASTNLSSRATTMALSPQPSVAGSADNTVDDSFMTELVDRLISEAKKGLGIGSAPTSELTIDLDCGDEGRWNFWPDLADEFTVPPQRPQSPLAASGFEALPLHTTPASLVDMEVDGDVMLTSITVVPRSAELSGGEA